MAGSSDALPPPSRGPLPPIKSANDAPTVPLSGTGSEPSRPSAPIPDAPVTTATSTPASEARGARPGSIILLVTVTAVVFALIGALVVLLSQQHGSSPATTRIATPSVPFRPVAVPSSTTTAPTTTAPTTTAPTTTAPPTTAPTTTAPTTTTPTSPAPLLGAGRAYHVVGVQNDLPVHTGPHLDAAKFGSYPLGAVVVVECITRGDPVTGPWGTDSWWDRVTYDGTTGWVTDEYVDTKDDIYDRSILPTC